MRRWCALPSMVSYRRELHENSLWPDDARVSASQEDAGQWFFLKVSYTDREGVSETLVSPYADLVGVIAEGSDGDDGLKGAIADDLHLGLGGPRFRRLGQEQALGRCEQ